MFYKFYKNKIPQYLFKLTAEKIYTYLTRNVDIPLLNIKNNFFKISVCPSTTLNETN